MTYGDQITASLREIGVLALGQPLKSAQADLALETLQALVDSWNAERLSIFTQAEATFSLVNGTQSYAVGAGQAFNIARPAWIDYATLLRTTDVPQNEYPLGPPLPDEDWADIRIKTLADSLVQKFRYVDSFPYGAIDVWPVPNVGTLQIKLYYPAPLTEPATIATVLSLPPGYRRALRTNLSVELASGPFDRPISPRLEKMAIASKAVIQRKNLLPGVMRPDPAMVSCGGGRYNIFTNGRTR